MKLKKLLSLLLILCLVFSFAACAGKDADDDDDESTSSSSQREDDDDDDDRDEDDKDKDDEDEDEDEDRDNDEDEDKNDDEDSDSDNDNDDEDGNVSDNDDRFSSYPEMELPEGYPKKDYPIYKGGRVWMGLKEESDGFSVFSVAVVFDEKADTIAEYYEELLKDSDEYDDMKTEFANVYKGKYEGYKFEITVIKNEKEEDLAQVTLVLTEIPSSSTVLKNLQNGEFPENYPENKFPIIDGGVIYDSSESENGGLVSYGLDIYTDKTIKEIIKFYEDTLTDIQDKSKSSSTNDFNLSGIAHDYSFNIHGYVDSHDNVELVRYFIDIDPIVE